MIKDKVALLNKELFRIVGQSDETKSISKRRLSPAARGRIAAAQRARWAKLRKPKADKSDTRPAVKKSKMNAAAKARVSARMKKYWKAKKAAQK